MKKWEYKILTASLIDMMIRAAAATTDSKLYGSSEALNALGTEGWEICAVWREAIILRREK